MLEAAGLGVGEVLGPANATEMPWRLERWETQHPVFQPFADPEHGDLRRPAFTAITRIKPDQDARVLAWFRGGEPALLERTKGRGKVLWFTSACDRAWGDWPRGRMYLPMIHQMVAYVSGLAEGGRISQAVAGDERKPGVGRVRRPRPGRQHRPARIRNGALHAERVCRPIRLPTARAGRGRSWSGAGHARIADDRLRSDEIWPWLALTLVGLLLVENFLANRTAA